MALHINYKLIFTLWSDPCTIYFDNVSWAVVKRQDGSIFFSLNNLNCVRVLGLYQYIKLHLLGQSDTDGSDLQIAVIRLLWPLNWYG